LLNLIRNANLIDD